MPPLKPRYETFCRHFLMDPNAGRAAVAAGYARRSSRQQGSRLLNRRDIAARIAELRGEMARDHGLDPAVLVAKLETVYRVAVEDRQCHAAARAVELQARLAGFVAAGAARAPAGSRSPVADGAGARQARFPSATRPADGGGGERRPRAETPGRSPEMLTNADISGPGTPPKDGNSMT